MNRLHTGTRLKRYRVKDNIIINLEIETSLGSKFSLKLENCSLSGLAGVLTDKQAIDEFNIGDLIANSKIKNSTMEHALGRLIVRVIKKVNEKDLYIGFSTIDSRMPIESDLSKYLDIDISEKKTAHDYELSPDRFSAAHFIETNFSNIDIFNKTKYFQMFLSELQNDPKFGFYNCRYPSKGTRIELERSRKNGRKDYLIMGSNDYLGLASHPRVIEAAKKALDDYGFGSTGSPVTTGITKAHEELTDTLARLFKKEKAIIFNSGFSANSGIITSLCNATDLVIADIMSHASIQDAMSASKATGRFFKHNDMAHLEKLLQQNRENFNGCLIVAEGIFSMDGDIAPINELVRIAKQYNCRIMVDEAHSFGVIGPNNLGASDKFGVLGDVDLIMGTFSKICGGIGGFVVGSKEAIDWIYYFARSHMFSVSMPPSTSSAMNEAIKIFISEPQLSQQLQSNIRHFVQGLRGLGFDVKSDHESAVIPVAIGDEKKLGTMNQILLNNGVFVVPILYPAVSRNNCRFRFTIMATHTVSDLDFALSILEKAMKEADFQPGPKKIEYKYEGKATSSKKESA